MRGALQLQSLEGELLGETDELVLCRCGNSATKPLCDGSHKPVGFESAEAHCPAERERADSPAAFHLAKFALEDARGHEQEVVPRCPFIAQYIRRHPEYVDLVPAHLRKAFSGMPGQAS